MTLQKIKIQPGFNTQLSQTANESGWFNGNLVRWKLGLLEKVGGWKQLFSAVCAGFIRDLHGWEDLQTNVDLLMGTDGGPQLFVGGNVTTLQLIAAGEIFPLTPSGVTTAGTGIKAIGTSGNTTITIQTNNLQISAGEIIATRMQCALGGVHIPVNSLFTVTTTTSINATTASYQFNLATAASTTIGATTPQPLLYVNGPSGSAGPNAVAFPAVSVQLLSHGLSNGSTFTFDLGTNVNFSNVSSTSINLAFSLIIPALTTVSVGVFDASNFTFNAASFVTGNWNVTGFGFTMDEGENYVSTSFVSSGGQTLQNGANITQQPLFAVVQSFSGTNLVQWYLDNLGANGLLVYTNSPVFVYQPPIANGAYVTNAAVATQVDPGAPQVNTGMFVAMPQAQVITFGTEPVLGSGVKDPLLLRFSDAGSYTEWTASVSNQAGSYRLSRGSMIVGGLQAPQTTLIWTDLDIWSMAYIGPPLVYGFTIMGEGCGLIAPHAMATLGRTTYWQSQNSFWAFGDSGVQALPCPVWDQIFPNINQALIQFCFAGANSSFHEVWFFYPSINATNYIVDPTNFTASAVWVPQGLSSVTSGVTDPFNGSTGSKLVDNSSMVTHQITQQLTFPFAPGAFTFQVYVSTTSTRNLGMFFSDLTGNNGVEVIIQVSNMTVLFAGAFGTGFSTPTVSVTTGAAATGASGNGWYLVSVSTALSAVNGTTLKLIIANFQGGTHNYTGDGVSGVVVAYSSLNVAICDSYVKYNALENLWDFGTLSRSAWMDNSVVGTPIGGDSACLVQQHEVGFDANGSPMTGVFAETGYAEVSEGDQIMYMDQVIPDLKWFGNTTVANMQLTMAGANYPGDTATNVGPFTLTPTEQFQTFRLRARQVAMRLDWGSSTTGFSARVEAMRFRVSPSGKRP